MLIINMIIILHSFEELLLLFLLFSGESPSSRLLMFDASFEQHVHIFF